MTTKKLHAEEMSLFAKELALVLKAGIPLNSGISTIHEQDPAKMDYVLIIEKELLNGSSFYEAIETTQCFDHYFLEMVKVGEKSGHLDDVMDALASYYERMDDIHLKIREVLFYPMILILMMLVVIGVIVIKVLPIFQNALSSIGSQLSPISTFLMDLGILLGRYGFIVLLIFCLVSGVYIFVKFKRNQNDDPLESFVFASLSNKIASAKVSYVMSLLLSSGYDIDEMFEMMTQLIHHPSTKDKLLKCRQLIQENSSVEDALLTTHLFTGLYERMITIGFKSGNGEEVMKHVSNLYEKDVDNAVIHYLNIMEPSIVALCSIVIGVILLSVMLPLLSIMQAL
ncbi:MAG: type II secretion system F family protein [Erysipelotrichaceae bacterium]